MATDKGSDPVRKDDHETDDEPRSESSSQKNKDVLEKASREATEDDHTVA